MRFRALVLSLCPGPGAVPALPGQSRGKTRRDYLTCLLTRGVLPPHGADRCAQPGRGRAVTSRGSGSGRRAGRGPAGAMSASAVYVLDLKGKVRPGAERGFRYRWKGCGGSASRAASPGLARRAHGSVACSPSPVGVLGEAASPGNSSLPLL